MIVATPKLRIEGIATRTARRVDRQHQFRFTISLRSTLVLCGRAIPASFAFTPPPAPVVGTPAASLLLPVEAAGGSGVGSCVHEDIV